MANPYVDTTLIECNRLQSTQQEQVETSESNAIFTNKTGSTIMLEQGDTISVQSAFINQKGCNIPTSLEFKGKYLTDVVLDKTNGLIVKNANVDYMGRISHTNLPELNDQVTTPVFDNKSTLEINYYKTSNGEQYTFLPRAFMSQTQQAIDNTDAGKIWSLWQTSNIEADLDTGVPGVNSGTVVYPTMYDADHTYTNFNDYHIVVDTFKKAGVYIDYKYLRPKNDNSKFTLMTMCYNWTLNNDTDSIEETEGGEDYINNGEEYLKYAWRDASTKLNPKYKRLCPNFSQGAYSPASNYYVKQIDNVEISVNRGFNSAESVANQITEDLQKYIETEEEGAFKPNNTTNRGVFSTTTTSLLRPRHCGSPAVFNSANFNAINTNAGGQLALDYYNSYKHILVKRPDLFIAGRACNNRFGQVPTVQLIGGKTPSPLIETTDPGIAGGTSNVNMNFVRNTIFADNTNIIRTNNNITDAIITSWLWNDTNLEVLRDLFIIQGNYEDLFKCDSVASEFIIPANAEWNNYYVDNMEIKQMPITATIKNSRFLHMTRVDFDNVENPFLGSDNYYQYTYGGATKPYDVNHQTAPVFFSFDPDKAYDYTDGASINSMCYGFATKTIDPVNKKEYIVIHPELVNGIRSDIFKNRTGKAGDHASIEPNSCVIGWDYHFNSYGNTVMMAQTGILNQTINTEWSISTGKNDTLYRNTANTSVDLNPYYTQNYLGSNNTACVYDPVSNKFGWEYLHIPENVGQAYNAGESEVIDPKTATSTRLPLLDDADNEVYKINKRLQYFTYCPDMVPYDSAIDGEINMGSGALTAGGEAFKASGPVELSLFNINLQPWTVFDAHTGVCLNFGKSCDKLNWNKSLLGILGFTFDQFNPQILTQDNTGTQSRLTFNNIKQVYNPTTNSEVVSANIKDYVITPYGATQYYPMPTFMTSIREFDFKLPPAKYQQLNYIPAISEATKSIILEAQLLPKTVLNPYLNIRSDIINESKYFGGKNSGLNYPICAVVNKINADKDFIQLDNSDIVFTCKKQMPISSITTVITDPDGSLALVDEGSSVIYKIQKQMSGKTLNIIGQVLQPELKKK